MNWHRWILLLLFFSPAYAHTEDVIAITHAKIHPIAGAMIEDGNLVIRNGKIDDIGKDIKVPLDAKVIDAQGQSVYPGFVDANCHAGLEEVSQVAETTDDLEGIDPITPQMRVLDGFFPESKTIGVTRVNGVTSCIVSPSSTNILAGISAWIEFSGKQVDSVALNPAIAMNATLGEAPKTQYGSRNKMPETRMGTAALLRATLQKAKEYGEKCQRYQAEKDLSKTMKDSVPVRDLQMESLQDVLSGKMPLVVSAHRADDILTAIRIAEEFGLKQNLIINHGTEAYKVRDVLAAEKIPVLVGPVTIQPDRMETLGAVYENAALLAQAGVLIAIQTDETHNVRNLPYEAAIAVANGLPYDTALQAITLNPARIFHMDSVIGSLEKGKRADLIVANGDPLEPRTEVTHVFIGGRELPDESYHRQLWEEFQKSRTDKSQP